MTYYRSDGVTLYHGDCLDVLHELPDESVHAVVTDPPYGLEFMGKAWDSFGRGEASSDATAGMSRTGYSDGGNRVERPSFLGGLNPRCKACGRSQRGGSPCRCDVPDFTDERGPRLRAFQAWVEEWARECLRVLKPGGHLLAFGGSRTWHRLAAGIEDAGFEIRDSIAWLYGSGFPKSMDVAKAITGTQLGHGSNSGAIRRATMGDDYTPSGVRGNRDGMTRRSDTGMADRELVLTDDARAWEGWGTALKPSFEPIVVARKPLAGTVAANVLAHGTGALNIDACRVPMSAADVAAINAKHAGMDTEAYQRPAGASLNLSVNPMPLKAAQAHDGGRWPSNVVLDEALAADLDAQSGVSTSRVGKPRGAAPGEGWGMTSTGTEHNDEGGASRFFPVFRWEAKAPASERPKVDGVQHPTVKPLGLMRWLCKLVTPPGGVILEPFAGSGTTLEAALLERFEVIGIEREADYLPLILSRLEKPLEVVLDLWGGDAA